jgi:RecJ-like exonuclease
MIGKKLMSGYAHCPVCKGCGEILIGDHGEIKCKNCEGSGTVPKRRDGTPCTHEFDRDRVKGVTWYVCIHCQHQRRSM